MTVLVTGGAGYIGSHAVLALLDTDHTVVVLDNLVTGVRENVASGAVFVEGDVGDADRVAGVLKEHNVTDVMHFAGSIIVPESVSDPLKYYGNNTSATRNLISCCLAAKIERFVFSSTAAVYGIPEVIPAHESATPSPINPYGRSKLMTEWMLRDTAAATNLRYAALRYFNVAGADPNGRTGQSTPEATHLIKVACQAALGVRDHVAIYGTDFDTPDGTGVRDYIHVTDLAHVHVMMLNYLKGGGESRVLNCGYGHGFSVREVLETVRNVSGVPFEIREIGRRAGDPPSLISDPSQLRQLLSWEPQYDNLQTIVETALNWERRGA